ncbi:MAG TPA: polysaccharide biosynthesis/export family protein [Pseudomonadales bacterium]|nr:polysaccharide biosynthesis/export family protein [Pseudomonadales bacterium]
MAVVSPVFFLTGCFLAPGNYMSGGELSNGKAQDVGVKLMPITPQLIMDEEKNRPPVVVPKELLDYQPPSYVIGPSDVLYVTVWDHPELTVPSGNQQQIESNGRLVRPNGEFFFPYIGNIHAAGMTIEGLAAHMTKELAKYIDNPQLDVAVIRYSSQRVYLSGAFRNGSPVILNSKPTTLAEILGAAGALGDDTDGRTQGDLSHLKFVRGGHEYLLNIYAINKESDYASRIYMKNGDTLHLDYNDQKKVFMMGEVKAPVALRFHADTVSLTDALTTVGGLDQRTANGESVFVIRGQNGDFSKETAKIYQLNAKSPTGFILANRFQLQPQDVVYVAPTDLSRWNRVVDELLPTLQLLNLTTQDAIQVKEVDNIYKGGSSTEVNNNFNVVVPTP